MIIRSRPYTSKIREVLKTVTTDPTPVSSLMEEHKVKLNTLKQGAAKYPTAPGRVRFGYLEDGTHVIYRDVGGAHG